MQLDQLSSPVTISGMGQAVAGKIGRVAVLDHHSMAVAETPVTSSKSLGPATFSVSVTYTTSVREGVEEGIVVFYAANGRDGPPAAAVTVKVLLSARCKKHHKEK